MHSGHESVMWRVRTLRRSARRWQVRRDMTRLTRCATLLGIAALAAGTVVAAVQHDVPAAAADPISQPMSVPVRQDAGVDSVVNLPPVPDAGSLVKDAGQPM